MTVVLTACKLSAGKKWKNTALPEMHYCLYELLFAYAGSCHSVAGKINRK